jgi:hypothetical protein
MADIGNRVFGAASQAFGLGGDYYILDFGFRHSEELLLSVERVYQDLRRESAVIGTRLRFGQLSSENEFFVGS